MPRDLSLLSPAGLGNMGKCGCEPSFLNARTPADFLLRSCIELFFYEKLYVVITTGEFRVEHIYAEFNYSTTAGDNGYYHGVVV